MVETLEKQQTLQFQCLDKLTLDKNIDRIIPFDEPNQYLTASYHLNKETQEKSGNLSIINITEDNKLKLQAKTIDFDYGVLSIKHESGNIYSIGTSKGDVQFLELQIDQSTNTLTHKIVQNYSSSNTNSKDSDLMKEQQTATNDICLMHDTSEKYVVNGMHGGRVLVHDRESGKILSDFIPHEYDIWYVHLTQDQNYLYTCGDDQKHIKHDLRMKLDLDQSSAPLNAVYTCKKHDAGVTWILKESAFDQSLDSSHYVMTGSYDGKIKLWDERNMRGGEVQSLDTGGKSVWDIKFNSNDSNHQSNLSFGAAAIYDGYLLGEFSQGQLKFSSYSSQDFNLDNFNLQSYTGHESICYAFEFIPNSDMILTSSFYDSTLHLLKVNNQC
eukprot:403357250